MTLLNHPERHFISASIRLSMRSIGDEKIKYLALAQMIAAKIVKHCDPRHRNNLLHLASGRESGVASPPPGYIFSSSAMTKKITKRHLKNGLLAFVDLLGFSARVESIKTEQALRALDDDVVFVQNQFEHNSPDKFIRQSHKVVGKSILAFSDCLVLSVPLRSPLTPIQGTFDILMSELTGFALSQGTCVLDGIFLRGGVDLGFWYRRNDSLISPALVRAYNLERDACVPMIAITSELRKYLSNHPHRRFYSEDLDPIPRTLKQYRKLPNGKACWFINYFRICLDSIEPVILGADRKKYQAEDQDGRDRMRALAWQKACQDWAKHHGQAILKAHTEAQTANVRAKYAWLAEYHNAEVKRFFRKAATPLLIRPA